MITLDPSQLPSPIATVLMLRGAELPSLLWQEGPNRAARKLIEETPLPELFGGVELRDQPHAEMVRAMLFLWTGWHDSCCDALKVLPQREAFYLLGFVERQAGHCDQAKKLLTSVGEHEIHAGLAKYAASVIDPAIHQGIGRLKSFIDFSGGWEPCLFADLFEQTRAGRFGSATEQIVRQMQCREFELLFAYAWLQTTGVELKERSPQEEARERRQREMELRKKAEERRREKLKQERARKAALAAKEPSAKKAGPAGDQEVGKEGGKKAGGPEARASSPVHIRCPKCMDMLEFPPTARGRKVMCGKCSAVFMIPVSGSAVMAESGRVNLRCPKCSASLSFPDEARGKTGRCNACGTAFRIPERSPAPARS